ncbi:ADP-ribosyltransferase [Chromobacterium piscinae]|uniref:ADP-ribosyltransferase n=2 Tax=Chromobacterium piscinae TaxID=686831 RepID=A0ABV0H9Y4_9NEIS
MITHNQFVSQTSISQNIGNANSNQPPAAEEQIKALLGQVGYLYDDTKSPSDNIKGALASGHIGENTTATLKNIDFSFDNGVIIPPGITLDQCTVTSGSITFSSGQVTATHAEANAIANGESAIATAATKWAVAYATADGATAYATADGATAYATEDGATAYATEDGATACAAEDGATAYATKYGAKAYAKAAGALAEAMKDGAMAYATEYSAAAHATEDGATAYAAEYGATAVAEAEGAVAYATEDGAKAYATEYGAMACANTAGAMAYAKEGGSTAYAIENGAMAFATEYGTTAKALKGGSTAAAEVEGAVAYANAAGAVAKAIEGGSTAYATVDGAMAYATVDGAMAYATVDGAMAYTEGKGTVGVFTTPPIVFSDGERNAINFYTGHGNYEEFNNRLRKGEPLAEIQKKHDSELQMAFARRPLHELSKTYRGYVTTETKQSKTELLQLRRGETVSDSAFLSTTRDLNVAREFEKPRKEIPDGHDAIRHEVIIFGKSGLDISTASRFAKEQEVLYNRGTVFTRLFSGMDEKSGVYKTVLKESIPGENETFNTEDSALDLFTAVNIEITPSTITHKTVIEEVADHVNPTSNENAPTLMTALDLARKPSPIAAKAEMDTTYWKKTGEQKGSNPGGTFTAPDGSSWYVKVPRTPDQARSEVLTAKLYQLAGVAVPNVELVKTPNGIGVASKIIDGLDSAEPADLANNTGALSGFAADAWLANWDVVGLEYDNLLIPKSGGDAVRIDTGGALEFRAQGGKKGAAFGYRVTELDTLRSADRNFEAASVFGHMKEEDIAASIRKVLSIPNDAIRQTVMEHGYGTQDQRKVLADKLISRKASLAV